MDIDIKDLPDNGKKELTIQLSVLELQPFLKMACQQLSQQQKIPGWRPGKVPYEILKQKIDPMIIWQRMANIAIEQTYWQTLQQKKIETVAAPQINIEKLAPDNPLVYQATIITLPKIKVVDYRSLKIKQSIVKVEESEIDKVLNNLRQMKAKEELVDRVVQNGDRVVLDINMFLANVPLEHGQSKDQTIIIGEKQFIPGIKEQIIGLHQGEKKEFPLIFPKKYHDQHLAGKKIDFKIEIKKVYQRTLPDLNDDFAQQIIKGQNLVDLKKMVKNNLFQQQQQQANQKMELALIDQMISKSTFEAMPEVLIDHEQEKMLAELEEQLKRQNLKFGDYLNNLKKTKEELKKELHTPAEKRVKTALIVKEIARQEKIVVEEEEIDEQIKQISKIYKDQTDVLEKIHLPANRHYLSNVIATRKTMEKIKKDLLEANNTSATKKE